MLEIRVDFRSHEEWTAWRAQHESAFAEWRRAILEDVNRFGVIEPISQVRHLPRAITINPANLRESVSAAEMNSRKRGGLLALDLAYRSLPAPRRQPVKILGAEAITRVARVLRGAFPHFLGTEYLSTEAEKERHFPIPHLDLLQADFPDAVFDMFYSGDVLEHVPDLDRTFREVVRMLRPGGVMVSTFPFNAAAPSTQRRASLDVDGRLVHHHSPEYHDNPMRPSEGSLVFFAPGWDILDVARNAGFADAKMTLLLSSTHGIVSAPVPGIFVMSASKQPPAEQPEGGRLARFDFRYEGPRLRKLVALLGLARSGTTLLCSILGVHSTIEAVYEPFNANKDRELPAQICIDRFFAEFPTPMHNKDTLLIKETATRIAFLDRTAALLRSVEPPLQTDLILLLRNPFHAFLSNLEAQKKWWGGPHELSAEALQGWAHHNVPALAGLLQLAREFNAIVVSYESLVADKERVVAALMHQLDLDAQQPQLKFEEHVDKGRVRGDVTIATEPFPVSDERVKQRAAELEAADERLRQAPQYQRVARIAELVQGFQEISVARFHTPAAQRTMRPLRELLADIMRPQAG
jgi:SAM-dependent methyltransferase